MPVSRFLLQLRRFLAAASITALITLVALALAAGPAAARTPSTGRPAVRTSDGGTTGGGGLAPDPSDPAPASPAPASSTPAPATAAPASSTVPPPPSRSTRGSWLSSTQVTQYWPVPEAWFTGQLVTPPGLASAHRIDWLYSATGVSMQGEGVGLDGQLYHIDEIGSEGWVTANGTPTFAANGWKAGAPFWRAGEYWKNASGGVTFPLQAGGWAFGAGTTFVPMTDVSFALGPAKPLTYMQSVAVDPSVIPLGSRVYIPAYKNDGHGGWFLAQDTGGGIIGHHVDVFRAPPSSPTQGGQNLAGQRIFVIKPTAS